MGDTTIYTDSNGVPFRRPEPSEFSSTVEFLRAFSAYKDAIADCATSAFDAQFRKAVRRG